MQIYARFLGSFCIFRTISYPSERLLYLLALEGVGFIHAEDEELIIRRLIYASNIPRKV